MKLKIAHNSIDYSLKLERFTSPAQTLNLSVAPIEISFYKPIKSLYLELVSREINETLVLQYWNGSAFVAVPGFEDYTMGLSASGYINIPEDVKQEPDTDQLYKLRINTSGSPSALEVNGIGLVLSCDKDFSNVPNVNDFLQENETSFIRWHEEATKMIVQRLRNSGKKIHRRDSQGRDIFLNARQVEVWDLLDISEFREAAKYLALHLLFDSLSKSNEDYYAIKATRFHDRYEQNYNSNLVSIDLNDNGKTEPSEAAVVQFIRIHRE